MLQQKEQENFKVDASAAAGIPNATLWNSIDEMETKMFTDLPFEQFIENNAQTLQDLGNCYAGVEYLRHIEGEKHLVFVTEKGMSLPRSTDDESLARAANDARVAIDASRPAASTSRNGGQVRRRQLEPDVCVPGAAQHLAADRRMTSIMDPRRWA